MENTALAKRDDQSIEEIAGTAVRPLVDIYENSDEYLIVADLPGVNGDQLRVDLDGDRLTLSTRAENAPNYLRTFSIPREIDRDKVSARLDAGVLSLSLPKSEAIKPRQIPISTK